MENIDDRDGSLVGIEAQAGHDAMGKKATDDEADAGDAPQLPDAGGTPVEDPFTEQGEEDLGRAAAGEEQTLLAREERGEEIALERRQETTRRGGNHLCATPR